MARPRGRGGGCSAGRSPGRPPATAGNRRPIPQHQSDHGHVRRQHSVAALRCGGTEARDSRRACVMSFELRTEAARAAPGYTLVSSTWRKLNRCTTKIYMRAQAYARARTRLRGHRRRHISNDPPHPPLLLFPFLPPPPPPSESSQAAGLNWSVPTLAALQSGDSTAAHGLLLSVRGRGPGWGGGVQASSLGGLDSRGESPPPIPPLPTSSPDTSTNWSMEGGRTVSPILILPPSSRRSSTCTTSAITRISS